MIPLRDINPTRNRPVVTYVLIGLNVLVFLYQAGLDASSLTALIHRYGMVPHVLLQQQDPHSLVTPLTSMFMHGGWLHLIFNMWTLHVFGDNVEDVLGKARFVFFYLLCGLGAAAAQALIDPSSRVPMVGASGAIAGVLAAYLRLFPSAKVVALIPLLFIFLLRELPAQFFIAFWFLLQLLQGVGSLGSSGGGGGVAFFAHIGGFVMGYLVLRRFLRKRRNPRFGFH